MFARRKKDTVTIHDDDRDVDVHVVIRKLNARSLDKARQQKATESSQSLGITARALGGEIAKALWKEDGTARKPAAASNQEELSIEEQQKARYDTYDRDSILVAGIDSWDALDDDGKLIPLVAPVTKEGESIPQGIADLDEPSAQTLHEAIVDLSLGPIQVKAVEEAAKNDSGPSIES